MSTSLSYQSASTSEPITPNVLTLIFHHLFLSRATTLNVDFNPSQHFCSLDHPCRIAWSKMLVPILSHRLVSLPWNSAIMNALETVKQQGISKLLGLFFHRVEDAYYPHPWHINTKVRKHAILRRFRVYRTITSEDGDRGVYLAYDFRSSDQLGCLQAARNMVIIKAWSTPDDNECVSEKAAYGVLCRSPTVPGIPDVLESRYDDECGVYAIALQRLGPTLEDAINSRPEKRFDEKMVLGVAIQLLERYKQIHSRGIIHNGIKPANICLPPAPAIQSSSMSTPGDSEDSTPYGRSMLYAIDFGFSSALAPDSKLPREHKADAVGNRMFLSVLGHHGITHSQRDDLESLAYLLSFLAHGHLPWSPLSGSGGPDKRPQHHQHQRQHQHQHQLWRIKMSTPASVLFSGMDPSFLDFWKEVKGLAFGEVPDYDAMMERFGECWRRRGWGGKPGEVDWSSICAEGLGLVVV